MCLPFVGHKPVRVHLVKAEREKPIADAVNAEQLIVLLSDPESALGKAIQEGSSDETLSLVIRRFEFRSVPFDLVYTV